MKSSASAGGRPARPRRGGLGPGERDVVADAGVEQHRLLQHHRDRLPHRGGVTPRGPGRRPDRPAVGLELPGQQPGQRGLPAAAGPLTASAPGRPPPGRRSRSTGVRRPGSPRSPGPAAAAGADGAPWRRAARRPAALLEQLDHALDAGRGREHRAEEVGELTDRPVAGCAIRVRKASRPPSVSRSVASAQTPIETTSRIAEQLDQVDHRA